MCSHGGGPHRKRTRLLRLDPVKSIVSNGATLVLLCRIEFVEVIKTMGGAGSRVTAWDVWRNEVAVVVFVGGRTVGVVELLDRDEALQGVYLRGRAGKVVESEARGEDTRGFHRRRRCRREHLEDTCIRVAAATQKHTGPENDTIVI
jgi:hypothetical protein